jgi:hypothetical protein
LSTLYSSVRTAVRAGVLKVFEGNVPEVLVNYSHPPPDATEPPNPYVVVNIITQRQIGRVETATRTDDEFNMWFNTHYEVDVQFSFCGSTAGDLAYEFQQMLLNNVVVTEAFQIYNLAPIRKSNVRRAPQKRDTGWVEYQNMDVTFSYAVQTVQPIDWVEHVGIDINSGEVNINITVPPLP